MDDLDIFDAPPAVAARPAAPPLSLEPKLDLPLQVHEATPIASAAPAQVIDTGVDALIRVALQSGADVDRLERLYRLKREIEADDAKRAMTLALAEFKKNAPKLFKDAHVRYETDKGVTEYDHATLGAICEVVVAALADYGLTHWWEPKTISATRVSVTCWLEHGIASRSVTLEADFDRSGGKNVIQGQGSAISYLERYSLLAVVGLAVKGQPDDDGRATQAIANTTAVLAEQILDNLLEQLPKTKTDAEALAHYQAGVQALRATKSIDAINELREKVAAHRHALREKEAA